MNKAGAERLVVLALIMVVTLSGATFIGSTPEPLPFSAQTTLHLVSDGETLSAANASHDVESQLIFSTASAVERPWQRIEIENTGGSTLRIDNVSVSNASFVLEKSQPTTFDINPGMAQYLAVAFRPTTVGVQQGELTLEVNGQRHSVTLRGLNAKGVEGGNEPNLQTIFDALGYDIDVAMPANIPDVKGVSKDDLLNAIGSTKSSVGDEVLVNGFERADATKPLQMIPLANYVHREKGNFGWFGINELGSNTKTQSVLAFRGGDDLFGGQNQQLVPGLGDGTYSDLVAGSSTSFVPKFEKFSIWDGARSNFSEDELNDAGDHSMRVYPAIRANGVVIPDAYIVADDAGQPGYKNFDYQDVVFLVTNVRAL